ncbi:MAG: hypothetical protein ACT4PV_02490 [Planctomycetaceae bacterium]
MQKLIWMLGAIALAIGPVQAGDDGCIAEEEGEICIVECDEDCSPEQIDAALDASLKARADAVEAYKALPETQRKALEEARAVIMTECPAAKAGMASMRATLRLLSVASAIDKAQGVAETPRAKLTAKLRMSLHEMCAAMSCAGDAKKGDGEQCSKGGEGCAECAKCEGACSKCSAAAKDPKALVKAAAAARKAADEALAAMAGIDAAFEAVPEETRAKVMAAYEVAAECPCFQAMTNSMGVIAMAVMSIRGQGQTAPEGTQDELGAAREACIAAAASVLEACGGSCNEGCGECEIEEAPAAPATAPAAGGSS